MKWHGMANTMPYVHDEPYDNYVLVITEENFEGDELLSLNIAVISVCVSNGIKNSVSLRQVLIGEKLRFKRSI